MEGYSEESGGAEGPRPATGQHFTFEEADFPAHRDTATASQDRPEPEHWARNSDRPKTAAGSRPGTTGALASRPSTGAARASAGAGGALRSAAAAGSRPMTSVSRPVSGLQEQPSGWSRPVTGLSAAADTRVMGDSAQWQETGRPGTSGRPFTGASGRPFTGAAPVAPVSRAAVSRAGSMRPVTGSMEKIRVMSRPITQQGLSGMKTGGSGRSRMVQDKSYFMGALRTRTSELRAELARLRAQADALNQEQATYTTYDSRVKQMAGELLDHQAELADYNVLVELMNMDSERALVDSELDQLRHANGNEALLVEKLFLNRKEKENEVQEIENQIEQERRLADTLVDAMSAEVRQRYSALRERSAQLQAAVEATQHQLDLLTARKSHLDTELAASPLKQEAATHYDKLSYMEAKRAELLDEQNARETPEQERERLLKQVKRDNQEMGALERRIHELRAEITKSGEDLEIAENDLEDSNSERNLKYRELRRREQEMQEFLRTYEQTKGAETRAVGAAQAEVVRTLEGVSRSLAHLRHLPSYTSKDLSELRDSLSVKEGEASKSRSTLSDLGTKHQQLQANHQKIEALDEKVREEMKTLREKMSKMREEMVVLSDLPALKQQHEQRTARLTAERMESVSRQGATRQQLSDAERQHAALQGELDNMDANIQLGILERRLASIEQNNFALLEFVSAQRAEVDYGTVRGHVMHTVYEHNKRLMEETAAGRATL